MAPVGVEVVVGVEVGVEVVVEVGVGVVVVVVVGVGEVVVVVEVGVGVGVVLINNIHMTDNNWGFGEELKKESDYFNFPAGETKLRVLTQPVAVRQYFKDNQFVTVDEKYQGPEKVSMKGWAWCVIRGTGELKIVKFPYSVIKKVQGFMVDEDYAFDGFPMPYDLKITATGEGMERRYEAVPSPKNTPVTDEEKKALEKKTSIQDILKKMKDKKAGVKESINYPQPDDEGIDLDNPPF